jgi:phytoene dehydrogenase-like protein
MEDVLVIGAGHNGLIAACYLAMSGRQVTVLEALDRPGGGSRTEERIPGYRFNLHSAAHNIINMTSIPSELGLRDAGLTYMEMDPFSVAVRETGEIVRFYRSIEKTVDSIAQVDTAEAHAYKEFMDRALPYIELILPAMRGGTQLKDLYRVIKSINQLRRSSLAESIYDLSLPYESLLTKYLRSDLTRGPIAAFAAHGGIGPSVSGGAIFALWQAAYHRFGQWHAIGGSQALIDALVLRLKTLGGTLRCSARVAAIERDSSQVRGVVLETGEKIYARTVVTAIDPKTALLELLKPSLSGKSGAELSGVQRGNVVQSLLHIAVDRLPPYREGRVEDWNGLQSYVDSLSDLTQAWKEAEAGYMPSKLPLYIFTPSALDPSLAPSHHHTIYLACPAAPYIVRDGWHGQKQQFIERAISTIESRAPGFSDTIVDVNTYLPEEMYIDGLWPGAHPMHIDISPSQLGIFRPTRTLGQHRTPISGLYISGAGTAPTGGIAGTPGKMAALAVLRDSKKR